MTRLHSLKWKWTSLEENASAPGHFFHFHPFLPGVPVLPHPRPAPPTSRAPAPQSGSVSADPQRSERRVTPGWEVQPGSTRVDGGSTGVCVLDRSVERVDESGPEQLERSR